MQVISISIRKARAGMRKNIVMVLFPRRDWRESREGARARSKPPQHSRHNFFFFLEVGHLRSKNLLDNFFFSFVKKRKWNCRKRRQNKKNYCAIYIFPSIQLRRFVVVVVCTFDVQRIGDDSLTRETELK
ncbi:hypothetical protein ABB37_07319 [Leptomonas pyrrhocoris]|uniref:Uncharacterized protein n=1 Tax=Leptomonas pyrrhocoris TaxID=157538 RepID=A0A0M9FVI1_LEPPY|nr:hypothetical protein ABB37_07319 [Leptomonas pyrrhocoris]KPA76940.1 hypothetical protein ABB37_07319 [Leptomonas pyrrhocoris]|eukprot:XP_015655379.1 hypothetical protein ABB37_07319 [Leptomonas pyrrhocoris]